MKPILRWFFAAAFIIIQVPLWNVWFLDYIDGHGKLWAFLLTPVFAALSAASVIGLSNAKDKPVVQGAINPFWGWFAGALILSVVFVLLSNT